MKFPLFEVTAINVPLINAHHLPEHTTQCSAGQLANKQGKPAPCHLSVRNNYLFFKAWFEKFSIDIAVNEKLLSNLDFAW
jgi:hypothetical protein